MYASVCGKSGWFLSVCGRTFVRGDGVLVGFGRVLMSFLRVLVRLNGVFVTFFMVAGGVMFGGRTVVLGGVFVVLRGGVVCFVCHDKTPSGNTPKSIRTHTFAAPVDSSRQRLTVFIRGSNLRFLGAKPPSARLTSSWHRYRFSTGCRFAYIIVICTITM